MDQLIPGADKDIVTPLTKRIAKSYEAIWLGTKVTAVDAGPDGLTVTFDSSASKDKAKAPETAVFDKVLVAVGRRPNGRVVGAEAAGVFVDERGFIPVDKQQRTNVGHIFAIGDVVGQPMLAHKATHEGKVAAESTRRAQQLLRRHRHPLGRLHRPRGRLGRRHRERGQGRRGQVRQGRVPLGRVRPVAVPRAATRA